MNAERTRNDTQSQSTRCLSNAPGHSVCAERRSEMFTLERLSNVALTRGEERTKRDAITDSGHNDFQVTLSKAENDRRRGINRNRGEEE